MINKRFVIISLLVGISILSVISVGTSQYEWCCHTHQDIVRSSTSRYKTGKTMITFNFQPADYIKKNDIIMIDENECDELSNLVYHREKK